MTSKIKGTTILVTGGAGFIGSYVVEQLIPLEPARIIIIDNFIYKQQGFFSPISNRAE